MRILAWCLMPNHFHLVLWPRGDGDVSRWMQWIQTTHVRRYHEHYHTWYDRGPVPRGREWGAFVAQGIKRGQA